MTKPRIQFRLRTVLALIAILCALLAFGVAEYRHRQAYSQAWYDLANLDMGSSISSDVKFHSRRATWSSRDVDELLRIIRILGRRRDFGFTNGVDIAVIDFKGSQISDASIAKIQRAVPDAVVLR